MSDEKFSDAWILGMVVSDGRPVADALVTLDYVVAQGQHVQLFSLRDLPVQSPHVKTNAKGGFVLSFHWDPTALGTTLDRPSYRLIANAPMGMTAQSYRTGTRSEGSLTAVVDLKPVASGRLPTFKSPTNVEGIVKDLKIVLKMCGLKFPNVVSLGRPSGDSYALLGAIQINV